MESVALSFQNLKKEIFDFRKFLSELKRWRISYYYDDEEKRIYLSGGNTKAREHFSKVIKKYPLVEALLILKLAENDSYLFECIEERAAIREIDAGLDGNLLSAIFCNFT